MDVVMSFCSLMCGPDQLDAIEVTSKLKKSKNNQICFFHFSVFFLTHRCARQRVKWARPLVGRTQECTGGFV